MPSQVRKDLKAMATTTSKLGRQIYLSRTDITDLHVLVGDRLETLSDYISEVTADIEDYQERADAALNDGDLEREARCLVILNAYEEDLKRTTEERDRLKKLLTKLWYYATPEETAARKAAQSE